MKALRFMGNGRVEVSERPIPTPQAGEVLVKIRLAALCGSDNEALRTGMESTPGHEMMGEIADANGSHFTKGQRVGINVFKGCGHCRWCHEGMVQLCASRTYHAGSHAEYAALPAACCLPIPEDLPDEAVACLFGDLCGVPWRTAARLPDLAGAKVFVSGAGPIGLGMTAMLSFMGADVAVSEPSEYRRELALSKAGAVWVADPIHQDVRRQVMDWTGEGADYCVECSGSTDGQLNCIQWVRPRGIVTFAGENGRGLAINVSEMIIRHEIRVHGVFYYAPSDTEGIVGLYRDGYRPEQLVSHRFGLADAQEACDLFLAKKAGKVLLMM